MSYREVGRLGRRLLGDRLAYRGTIALRLGVGAATLNLSQGAVPATAQQPATGATLVFDRVTVVDVGRGALVLDQRVVIVGHRIRTVGAPGW